MYRTIALLFAISVLAVLPASAAETYIIPVWGEGVRGAAGTYSSVISFTNASDDTVIVKVADVVPIRFSEICPVSVCSDSRWVVRPHSTLTHGDIGETGVFFKQRRLFFGAIVLEASAPLHVESDISLRAPSYLLESWQSVQIAPAWLVARSVIPRAIPVHSDESDYFKLYLINPNDFPIRIDYSAHPNGRGTAMIAARAIEVITLPATFACPEGCGGIERPTGSGDSVELMSDFPYLAASVSHSMQLPPLVHVALPER